MLTFVTTKGRFLRFQGFGIGYHLFLTFDPFHFFRWVHDKHGLSIFNQTNDLNVPGQGGLIVIDDDQAATIGPNVDRLFHFAALFDVGFQNKQNWVDCESNRSQVFP